MSTLVVVHPTYRELFDAGGSKKKKETLKQALNDAAEAMEAIQVLPYTEEEFFESGDPVSLLDNGITTIFDGFSSDIRKGFITFDWDILNYNKVPYVERGLGMLRDMVPEGSEIHLAGFKHSACVRHYARELAPFYRVKILEELTNLFCNPSKASDGARPETRLYEPLLEKGVEFVPAPIKVKTPIMINHIKGHPVPSYFTFDNKGEAFELLVGLMKSGIPLENLEYSEPLLYQSALRNG